tara:strand:+ start:685 stop:1155 length:471 start_codon:yes stop_codon:yes gene_type:complete
MNFYSPDQAIKFAFKTRDKSIVSRGGTIFSFKDKFRHDEDKLTPFDFHAQSALILSFINRQQPFEILWAYWTYGNPHEKEASAKQLALRYKWRHFNLERDKIYHVLTSRSVRQCARNMSITNYKAWKYRRKALKNLAVEEESLTTKLWDWLKQEYA